MTPFIDRLQENVTKGWLISPTFGGGTAHTEYEVLTGNSVWLLEENPPIAYQVHSQKNEYGLTSTLAAQGYRTLAMHPHAANNFNRKQVYPRMGFERFISLETWPEEFKKKIRSYISDRACFDYLAQIYGEKEPGEKLFTFLVTMQNHGGYTKKKYKPTVSLPYEQDYPQARQFLSLLKETDAAFETLIRHFETVEEPTMIVMFGDHWPNLQDGFYDTVLQDGLAQMPLEEQGRMEAFTPFVIWTNYDRETQEGLQIGANYFGSYLLQQAGAQLTDYNKFLLEMEARIPAIRSGEILTADGTWLLRAALPDSVKDLLNEYQIMQYNNMFGAEKKVSPVFTLD